LAELKAAIRKGVIANAIYPVFCGTALQNIGVQLVLDAVVEYLPSPLDLPEIEAHDIRDEEKRYPITATDDKPFVGLAFKMRLILSWQALLRPRLSGVLTAGSYIINSSTGNRNASAVWSACTLITAKKSKRSTPATSLPLSA
jgi:elongation factor G